MSVSASRKLFDAPQQEQAIRTASLECILLDCPTVSHVFLTTSVFTLIPNKLGQSQCGCRHEQSSFFIFELLQTCSSTWKQRTSHVPSACLSHGSLLYTTLLVVVSEVQFQLLLRIMVTACYVLRCVPCSYVFSSSSFSSSYLHSSESSSHHREAGLRTHPYRNRLGPHYHRLLSEFQNAATSTPSERSHQTLHQ